MRVVANSIPKSGTHLLARLLDLLGMTQAPLHLSGSLVRQTSRNPLRRLQIASRRAGADDADGLRVDLDEPGNRLRAAWLRKRLAALPENGYHQAHLPYSDRLETFLLDRGMRLLMIVRDPRDVAFSFVNHMLRDPGYPHHRQFRAMHSVERCLLAVLDGGVGDRAVPRASLADRIGRAIGWYRSERTLGVRFEDLIGSEGGGGTDRQNETVRRICSHLQLELTDGEVDRLAADVFDTKAPTFHKGKIGTWKEVFTPKVERRFADTCGPLLEQLGYG